MIDAPPHNKPHSTAILLERVSIRFGETRVLEDVTAHVPSGESTAVVGPNGAGKTSLTLAILGQAQFSGSIRFPNAAGGRPRFGFVPQKLQFDREMPMTVLEYLLAGIQRRPLFLGRNRLLESRIRELLEELECSGLHNRMFGALSGGEIQRVLLAQALLQNPEILILDEPTAGVDFKGGQICCELLRRVREKYGFTQLMISHDLATVAAHATHVICINRRVIAEGAPRQVLTHEVLTETFGLHLGIADLNNLAAHASECGEHCPHFHRHEHSGTERTCSCSMHHRHEHGEQVGPNNAGGPRR